MGIFVVACSVSSIIDIKCFIFQCNFGPHKGDGTVCEFRHDTLRNLHLASNVVPHRLSFTTMDRYNEGFHSYSWHQVGRTGCSLIVIMMVSHSSSHDRVTTRYIFILYLVPSSLFMSDFLKATVLLLVPYDTVEEDVSVGVSSKPPQLSGSRPTCLGHR